MKRVTVRSILSLLVGILAGASAMAAESDKDLRIAAGLKVTIEFTLTGPDKNLISSTQEPLSYLQGAGQIFPALEKALVGLKAGDKKRVDLLADQTFGVYDPQKKVTVDRTKVPPDAKVGSMLSTRDGGPPVKVVELNDKTVVLDTNHPLAGKNVTFEVKVVKVERDAGAAKK